MPPLLLWDPLATPLVSNVYVSSHSIMDVSIVTEYTMNPLEFSGPVGLPRPATAPGLLRR